MTPDAVVPQSVDRRSVLLHVAVAGPTEGETMELWLLTRSRETGKVVRMERFSHPFWSGGFIRAWFPDSLEAEGPESP